MDDSNKKEFAAMMYAFGDIYEIDFSKVMLGLWFEALEEYDLLEVAWAIKMYMKSPDPTYGKPKPNDIIRLMSGSTADKALTAWTQVDKSIRMIGDYATVCFDDPVIHRVISDMGGWIGFGDKNEKDWPFVAKEFQERYRALKATSRIPEHPRTLVGQTEAANSLAGYLGDIPEPVLIGDEVEARAVMLGAPSGKTKLLQ